MLSPTCDTGLDCSECKGCGTGLELIDVSFGTQERVCLCGKQLKENELMCSDCLVDTDKIHDILEKGI